MRRHRIKSAKRFPHDEYEALISDDTDTNIVDASGTDMMTALDRIIATGSLVRRVGSNAGIIRFSVDPEFSRLVITATSASDHFPVWLSINGPRYRFESMPPEI